ncbi:hypothetical protein B0H11DRAFT_1915438 [Mycena galericulata]|nr:hypothetical protein B0H11DRAFT_1915438 [Mycena galericulata]
MPPRTTRPPTPESEHSWWSDSNPTGPTIPLHAMTKPLIKLMYRVQGTSSIVPRTPRPPTPQSAHSWWSDSNRTGATIPLHTLAKPLLKFLHHRKALGLIKKYRGTPLSDTSMDIYSSYLGYKYLRFSTKTAIIHDLDRRAVSEQDAHAVVRSLGSEDVTELLESPNAALRSAAWKFLGELARYESTTQLVLLPKMVVSLRVQYMHYPGSPTGKTAPYGGPDALLFPPRKLLTPPRKLAFFGVPAREFGNLIPSTCFARTACSAPRDFGPARAQNRTSARAREFSLVVLPRKH